ncbi:reverse transcriptase, partial [Globisporangium splendens]
MRLRAPADDDADVADDGAAARGPLMSIFRHNDSRFGCAACADEFRHYGALVAHRRSAHRTSVFEDWFQATCPCSALFGSRLDAFAHSGRCDEWHDHTNAPQPPDRQAPAAASAVADEDEEMDGNAGVPVCTASGTRVHVDDTPSQASLSLAPQGRYPRTCPSCIAFLTDARSWHAHVTACAAANVDALLRTHAPSTAPAPTDDHDMDSHDEDEFYDAIANIDDTTMLSDDDSDDGQMVTTNVTATAVAPAADPERRAAAEAEPAPRPDLPAATAADLRPPRPAPRPDEPATVALVPASRPVEAAVAAADEPPFGVRSLLPWQLRCDRRLRRNPRPAGAGAALTRPNGKIFWTSYRYIADCASTNNTAEYNAIIDGLLCAVHHGVKHVRIEGDSKLVIEQIKGMFACGKELRPLRDLAYATCQEFESYALKHIDRLRNSHADRLANRALDLCKCVAVCAKHTSPGDAAQCWHWPGTYGTPPTPDGPVPMETDSTTGDQDQDQDNDSDNVRMDLGDPDPDAEADAANADRDGGTIFPVLEIGPGVVPLRQPRLRVPRLAPPLQSKLEQQIQTLARRMADKITDAPDWRSAEGYITAITAELSELLTAATKLSTQPGDATGDAEHANARSTAGFADVAPHAAARATGARQSVSRPTAKRNRRDGSSTRPRSRPRRKRRNGGPTLLQLAVDSARDELSTSKRLADKTSPSTKKTVRKAARRVARLERASQRQATRQLFMSNERQCVSEILHAGTNDNYGGDNSCPIEPRDLYAYFQTQATPPDDFDFNAACGARFREAIDNQANTANEMELLTAPIARGDIEDQLDRAHKQSAPGLDGIPYDVYVRFKLQLLDLLHAVFNACWTFQSVPRLWKVGYVRLIYKRKGERGNPSNWRPICLQQTVYKLYAGVLAVRFQRWMDANARFTFSQKGFRSFNGCNEHNFVATSLYEQARRTRKKLFVVWYDLRNAFGSLPQAYMWKVLERLGVPHAFLQVVRDIYTDSYFIVDSRDGTTDPVHQGRGVYQGCPLSPYLFIAALTPLMFVLDGMKSEHGVSLAAGNPECTSAYADDLKIFAKTATGIRALHGAVLEFLQWTRMEANASKCALMVSDAAADCESHNERLDLSIHDNVIPRLTGHDGYVYLGIEDGPDHARVRVVLQDTLRELTTDVIKLLQSPLAPWQIMRAIKSYVLSKLDYPLRHLRPFLSMFDGFDKTIVRGLKRLLQLPQTATTEFLYAPTSAGGLGLLPLRELYGALKITHGLQMLHSQDPNVRAIARGQLLTVIRKRFVLNEPHWTDREEEAIQMFLNSELAGSAFALKKKVSGDSASLWVDVATYLKTFELKLGTVNGEHLQLQVPHTQKALVPKEWGRQIKTHLRLRHLARWRTFQDQGKTARLHGGAGSAFLTRPSAVYDSSYRFAVRARLNQVDTRSALKRKHIVQNNRCRAPGCNDTETLAHVLHHCSFGADAIRVRHDESLQIIRHRVVAEQGRSRRSHQRLLIDATVPGMEDNDTSTSRSQTAQRPDVQLYDDNAMTASIVDLAVAFEDQATDDAATSSNFARVRAIKIKKYENIVRFLEYKGYTVHVGALVYGSLGSICSSNLEVYTDMLGMRKGVSRALERQLSARHVNFSHRIWKRHAIANGETRLLTRASAPARAATTNQQREDNCRNSADRIGTTPAAAEMATTTHRTQAICRDSARSNREQGPRPRPHPQQRPQATRSSTNRSNATLTRSPTRAATPATSTTATMQRSTTTDGQRHSGRGMEKPSAASRTPTGQGKSSSTRARGTDGNGVENGRQRQQHSTQERPRQIARTSATKASSTHPSAARDSSEPAMTATARKVSTTPRASSQTKERPGARRPTTNSDTRRRSRAPTTTATTDSYNRRRSRATTATVTATSQTRGPTPASASSNATTPARRRDTTRQARVPTERTQPKQPRTAAPAQTREKQ